MPEAIGTGGVVLDYDAPLDQWVQTVRGLWDDRVQYNRMSAAARVFSERPQLEPDAQFATFMGVLDRAAVRALHKAA